MAPISKKEQFKFLIREFHAEPLPETIPRDLAVPLDSRKIVALYGPRRSGKSFTLYTLIKELLRQGVPKERILYLNFEDDRILPLKGGQLQGVIEAFFELYPECKPEEIFLFFDEIQNVEDWEIFVRRVHDKEKARIFLTGSSSKMLSQEIATALRGRTIGFSLRPLSFSEFLRFRGIRLERNFPYGPQRFQVRKSLQEYLEYGGFPEVVLEKDAVIRHKILEEYFESLVYRDLVERHRIENVGLLKDLLKTLLANSTHLFSVNAYHKALRQSLSVSRQTVTAYLRLIQETGYITLFPKFSWSLKEQRVNPQKIVCLDLGIRNRMTFRFSQDEGKAAENLVGSVLSGLHRELFYWQGKREVDFVVHGEQGLQGINVTFGPGIIEEREMEGLLEFRRRFKQTAKLLLITRDAEEKKGPVRLIPLWKWLLT